MVSVLAGLLALVLLAGCQPPPQVHVAFYLLSQRLRPAPAVAAAPGTLEGQVVAAEPNGQPIAGASVVAAEPNGRPHTALTDAGGRYHIAGLPPGRYAPAAVAPGSAEAQLSGLLGLPLGVRVDAGTTTQAPPLTLPPYAPPPLPANLAQAVALRQTGAFTATAPFPVGSTAEVRTYAFDYNGVTVDTLRLYLPLDAPPGRPLPLVLFVAPTAVDDWQNVSAAFAAQGYAVVAISPVPARGVNADAQAMDARVALELARSGALGPEVGHNRPVVMGGSYSSAILARLIRAERGELGGWVTVGGLADAFRGAEAFYAGQIELPENYRYLVPAFGPPNLYPLELLRYSPVFLAGELPPTLIIHTAADHILPIEQAYALEAAVKAAGVPVETYYYPDVSHYLGIGDNLTEAGKEMFHKIEEFIGRYGVAQ